MSLTPARRCSPRAGRLGARGRFERPRGVAMLFFLVTIPVIFFIAAAAVDIGRLLEVHRSVSQAAGEAAQSGAMSYQLGSGVPTLAMSSARAEAERNWNRALAAGVVGGVDPALDDIFVTPRDVTVVASAAVPDLLFLRFFAVIGGDGVWRVSAEGRATVCLAGFEGQEACTRPDVR